MLSSIKEEKLTSSDGKRRFRLRPITAKMRKFGQGRKTYSLNQLGYEMEDGKQKLNRKGEPIGLPKLKFWQSNFEGQKHDPAKENIHVVNDETARYLETMSDIFEEIFNDDMTSLLENVLDDLEMDDEVVTDANEYRRILKYIKDKFGLDKPYPIKTSDEGIEIVFKGVNPKTSKINFELVNPEGEKKEGSAKLSTIIKLLNNYTLFHPF